VSQWSCGLRLRSAAAGLLGLKSSNPIKGIDVRLLCLLCVVQVAVSSTS
jgi:hypothetical protein